MRGVGHRFRVGRVTAMAIVLTLCAGAAWAATLTWNADTDSDLAGYRIYTCSQLPCTKAAGTANMLASVGTVTSFNIGTPVVVQYYVLTAYDYANNESKESEPAVFIPTGSTSLPPPPQPAATPPPPPLNVRLSVLN
ncbi:MAG TPA: hypothetical protein VJ746_19165 [Nitrospira sp.]|nr:hypothetical protein [Nitrospira sp.]